MDWATRKRLIYFVVLALLVLGLIVFVGYSLLNRPPTCSDNKQNGTELGIDCGGQCAYLCASNVTPLRVLWVRALPARPKEVNLVAYLQNQNKTARVAKADYKFTVYDDKAKVVYTKEGSAEITPNGNVAIFVSPINIGERKVQRTLFEWTSPLLFTEADPKNLESKLITIDTKLTTESGTELIAKLENPTRLAYRNVPVVAILYGKEGNALLASRTVLDDVEPNAKVDAFFSWKAVPTETVERIEILPYFEEVE